ncbi:MAG: hypothetical protein GX100_12710 [candidate division WS1 bacterium]|nr:hypothetical protein [candidate division WS1 bacterium]
MRRTVGVMGSAGGVLPAQVREKCYRLGQVIARHDCLIVTGACPGLPHEAVLGAKSEGAFVVGISPALSLDEHVVRYRSPYVEYDTIIFTGSGLMGREITTIRTCDMVVICGGRSGTLGEFAIAYDEGKLIGVLEGTGGIADHLHKVVSMIQKDTRAAILYDSDPEALVDRLVARHEERVMAGTAYLPPEADG